MNINVNAGINLRRGDHLISECGHYAPSVAKMQKRYFPWSMLHTLGVSMGLNTIIPVGGIILM